MKKFSDIQTHDVLLYKNRRIADGKTIIIEWKKAIVQEVTRAFYTVDGKKIP